MIEYLINIHADGKQVAGEARRAGDALGGIETAAQRIGGRLATLFGFREMASLARRTMDFGSQITAAAQKTGITVEAIQAFKFAAEQSDASLEDVTNSIRYLSRAMAEAASTGKGDAYDAFRRFGVQLSDIQSLSPDKVFLKLAEVIQKLPPSARVTADALTVLGRGADSLFPAFREGFASAAKSAADLGHVLGADVIKKLDDAGDSLVRIQSIWRTIAAQAMTGTVGGVEAMSFVEDFSKTLRDKMAKSGAVGRMLGAVPIAVSSAAEALGRQTSNVNGSDAAPILKMILDELKGVRNAAKEVF